MEEEGYEDAKILVAIKNGICWGKYTKFLIQRGEDSICYRCPCSEKQAISFDLFEFYGDYHKETHKDKPNINSWSVTPCKQNVSD